MAATIAAMTFVVAACALGWLVLVHTEDADWTEGEEW